MKNVLQFILLAFVVLSGMQTFAQAPTFDSAKTYAADSIFTIEHAKSDALGNSYIYGYFYGTADLDLGPGISNFSSPSMDFPFFFLQKQAPDGSVVWTREVWFAGITDMAIDSQGNIITVASFNGGATGETYDVDPGPGTTNVTFSASIDVLTIKYSPTGEILWANASGLATESESVRAVTVDNNGDIIFSAYSNNGTWSYAVLIKRNASGALVWQKNLSSGGYCDPTSITIDASNNVIVTGRFSMTIDFNPGPGEEVRYSAGSSVWDIFVLKLNSSGDFVWVNEVDGMSNNLISLKVVTDATGNIYQLGGARGPLPFDFDPSAGVDELNPNITSYHRAYIRKINSSGTHQWVAMTATSMTLWDLKVSLVVDVLGQVLISSHLDFAGFDTAGNELFQITLNQNIKSMFANPDGSVYLAGNYYQDIVFDANAPNGTLFHNHSNLGQTIQDGFIAKYNQCFVNINTTFANNTLTVSQENATYQWLDCDNANAPIVGATAQSYTPTESGNYAVIVTSGTCSDTSACASVTVSSASIFDYDEQAFSIYPNPAKIQVSIDNVELGSTITIFDVSGKIVYSAVANTSATEINVSAFVSGMYFVQVANQGVLIGTQKLQVH